MTTCLVFEGLDTFATVYLDGAKIAEGHRTHGVDTILEDDERQDQVGGSDLRLDTNADPPPLLKASGSILGQKILESDNMFLSHRVDITHLINDKKSLSGRRWGPPGPRSSTEHDEYTLTIDFESALERGDEIMAKNGGERATWNGHYSRLFVRKAQYHYVYLQIQPVYKERKGSDLFCYVIRAGIGAHL